MTIQNGAPAEKRQERVLKPPDKRQELIVRVKYSNTLPDIPFDLKFISYPFEPSRFIQYNPTSLERNYRYDVLTEHDLGVNIDLINKDTYATEPGVILDAADEKLLEEDILAPQDSKRSRHHAKAVSWLRRTEYISTEQTRFQPQTMDKVEAKVGFSIKKSLNNETHYMDRDAQVEAIEKTFTDSKIPIEKHYSKPNVVPVEAFPVYPDFNLWKYPCAQVIFDSDPAPVGKGVPAQIEEMSQAMLRLLSYLESPRIHSSYYVLTVSFPIALLAAVVMVHISGVMDESGEQFVAYFLPIEETLKKRREDFANSIAYQDDEEYEYKMAREYNWNVKSKASKGYEENYFFVTRADGVYYNELETRVRLSKRRQKVGQAPSNTRLVVKHRVMSAEEFGGQRYREKQLEPPREEDEEEFEMEETKEDDQAESDQEKVDDKPQDSDNESKDGRTSRQSRASSRKSKSASRSPSRSKSGSRSSSKSKSRSRSRSKSKSPSRSRSASASKSSKSPSRSRSASKSPSRSRSRSKSASRSRSRSKSGGSRSGSASGSGYGSASESE